KNIAVMGKHVVILLNYAMGNAAELCASTCNFSREDQDQFAIESYKRSQAAWAAGPRATAQEALRAPNARLREANA
ncbi:hypothetical protein EBT31_19710, partial [bacterium]|nr:hypothetical protein [bacterium]